MISRPIAVDWITLNDRRGVRDVLIGALLIAGACALGIWVNGVSGRVAGALVFVLGIMVIGAVQGLAGAMVAALFACVTYNFFLAEPFQSFRMAEPRDLQPLIAFNISALITGMLAGRMRDRTHAARRSNQRLSTLLELSKALQSAIRPSEIARIMPADAIAPPGSTAWIFVADGERLVPADSTTDGPSAQAAAVANAVWRRGNDEYREGDLRALLLRGGAAPVGVLVVVDDDGAGRSVDASFANALSNVLALALQRAELFEQLAEAKAVEKSEKLKTALLSSVSHDFRTPLSTIRASASSLLSFEDQLDTETRHQMLRSIAEDCERLDRYTGNLLELSRLDSGSGVDSAHVLDVVDVANAAISAVEPRLGSRRIERAFPSAELLARADPVSFELVLINLLDNAIAYSESNARIRVGIEPGQNAVLVRVSDEGAGIPHEDLERVFERFYRVRRTERRPHGSGLGLAIAKSFVVAFGGRIRAEVPGLDGKGTSVVIELPTVAAT